MATAAHRARLSPHWAVILLEQRGCGSLMAAARGKHFPAPARSIETCCVPACTRQRKKSASPCDGYFLAATLLGGDRSRSMTESVQALLSKVPLLVTSSKGTRHITHGEGGVLKLRGIRAVHSTDTSSRSRANPVTVYFAHVVHLDSSSRRWTHFADGRFQHRKPRTSGH